MREGAHQRSHIAKGKRSQCMCRYLDLLFAPCGDSHTRGAPFVGELPHNFRMLEAVWLVLYCMQLREAFQALQTEYKVHTETAKAEVIGEPPQALPWHQQHTDLQRLIFAAAAACAHGWSGIMLATSHDCTCRAELGGLHVVGTERHESRRIDNQLRGRTARHAASIVQHATCSAGRFEQHKHRWSLPNDLFSPMIAERR
jgi:hypothetical protein